MDDCLIRPMSTRDLARALVAGPAAALPARRSGLVLGSARISRLGEAMGAEGMSRTVLRSLRDTAATPDRLRRAVMADDPLALCHEIAGAASMVGAVQLQAHVAGLEARLRAGEVTAVMTARADSDRAWSTTEAALTALVGTRGGRRASDPCLRRLPDHVFVQTSGRR